MRFVGTVLDVTQTSHFKIGHCQNQIRPLRVETGQYLLEELKKANPKDEDGRRKHKNFQWLTNNVGYPKLREHLGSVVAIMKLSADWHDFRAKLDKLHPPFGKATR